MTKVTIAFDNSHTAKKPIQLSCNQIDNYMTIIVALIIVSLIIAIGFLAAFIWAVKSGQYDDDYTPSVRILFDDNDQQQAKNN